MEGDDPKQLVADGYDRLHDAYAEWTSSGSPRRRYLDRVFQLGLTPPATALDLGCGTGRHATRYLVERGLDVTGVDISPRSIEAARVEVPGARFLVADMSTVQFPAGSFDLVTAFYSIIHLPREEHAGILARIATWLRPGGYLVASMGGAERGDTSIEDRWLGLAPMYWSNWDASTNRRLVAGTGLDVVEAQVEAAIEDGREVRFLWVLARKP